MEDSENSCSSNDKKRLSSTECNSLDTSSFNSKLTNQHVLFVLSVSFGLFAMAELAGAILSHSLSLLGDAGAMSVDVFTYFGNMLAEHLKHASDGNEITERKLFVIEFFVPMMSVCALLGVSTYIGVESIKILFISRETSNDNVDDLYLFFFSGVNLLVDIVGLIMFYCRGKSAFISDFIQTMNRPNNSGSLLKSSSSKQSLLPLSSNSSDSPTHVNLNMLSAFTHVGGDLLRSLSVFIAAFVSAFTGVSSDVCDAWAALVISVTIFIAVMPLLRELYHKFRQYNDI